MEWKPVHGREGQYEVSSTGEIRKCLGKLLGQWKSDQGYMLVRLSKPRKTARVHRLVAEAFIENPNNLPFVNHIDCKRDNNDFENLEWCTQRENLAHSRSLGRMQRDYWKGKRSPNATLDAVTVNEIRKAYSLGGVSWQALSKRFGVSKRTIGRIVNGESYV